MNVDGERKNFMTIITTSSVLVYERTQKHKKSFSTKQYFLFIFLIFDYNGN
jgi:hypothetical protein